MSLSESQNGNGGSLLSTQKKPVEIRPVHIGDMKIRSKLKDCTEKTLLQKNLEFLRKVFYKI